MELKIKIEVKPCNGLPAMVMAISSGGAYYEFPYEDNMTIGEMFAKLSQLVGTPEEAGYRPIMPDEKPSEVLLSAAKELNEIKRDNLVFLAGIQERDVVRCIATSKRDDGLSLVIGKEYTVIKKMRMKDPEAGPGERKFITVLEVLDVDHGRIQVFEDEMEFVRHNPPPQAPTYDKYEETRVCENCRQNYSVWKSKTGGEYQGICPCLGEPTVAAL